MSVSYPTSMPTALAIITPATLPRYQRVRRVLIYSPTTLPRYQRVRSVLIYSPTVPSPAVAVTRIIRGRHAHISP